MIVISSSSGILWIPSTRSRMGRGGHRLVHNGRLRRQILKNHRLHTSEIERHALQEGARADDPAQPRLGDGILDQLLRKTVVEVDRDPPVERERHVGHRRGYGGRHEDPDGALPFRSRAPQQTAQHQSAQQDLSSGERRPGRIGQRHDA